MCCTPAGGPCDAYSLHAGHDKPMLSWFSYIRCSVCSCLLLPPYVSDIVASTLLPKRHLVAKRHDNHRPLSHPAGLGSSGWHLNPRCLPKPWRAPYAWRSIPAARLLFVDIRDRAVPWTRPERQPGIMESSNMPIHRATRLIHHRNLLQSLCVSSPSQPAQQVARTVQHKDLGPRVFVDVP